MFMTRHHLKIFKINKPVKLFPKKKVGHWRTEGVENDWQK